MGPGYRSLAWLLLVGAALAVGSRAQAQRTVYLVPAQAERSDWDRVAMRVLAELGVDVLEPEGDGACVEVACAAARAGTVGASSAALVRFDLGAGGRPRRVTVVLVRRDGETARAQAKLLEGGAPEAVKRAYRDAQLSLSLGQDALIGVTSRPSGALVHVDGEPAGQTPLDHRLEPGRHRIEARADGFVPVTRTVQAEAGRAIHLALTLEREVIGSGSREPDEEASPLNWIVGLTLVGGSAPALVSALTTLAQDGRCVGELDAANRCQNEVHFGGRSSVLLGVGLAALVGGTYVLIGQPFTVAVEASSQTAGMRLGGHF